MRVFQTASAVLAIVLLAGVAWPDDTFQGGEFTTTGDSSKGGSYTGTLKVTPSGPGRFHVSDELHYGSGKNATYSGEGVVTGDTLKVAGATTVGLTGALSKKKGDQWSASFKIAADGSLTSGTWKLAKGGATGSETITAKKSGAPSGKLLVLPDKAVVAVNLDDDDNDGGAGGDGVTAIVSDKDDADGVANEDDLLAFQLAKPKDAPAGARFLLSFSSKVAVWRTKTKMPGTRINSGDSFAAADETLWLEGLEASAAGPGESISAQLLAANGTALLQDERKVSVARSAFLLLGHGNSGSWALASWLDSHKVDARTNPVLVRGKDEKGQPQAWAVYLWNTEKGAKIALATPGAVIAYDGHSNFGLGYAFKTNFTSVSQFMNIADAQVPVNWEYLRDHQEHPNLVFEDSEYGDDASTATFSDPVGVDRWVQGEHDQYYTRRWPIGGSASGTRYPLVRGKDFKWQDHHYLLDNDATNARIVVKAGAKDMPAKRWSKLFLNSCYSGPYYYDSFGGHGTLFFTTEEASSPQTSASFIESAIDGKSNDDILKALNKLENINDYHVFGE